MSRSEYFKEYYDKNKELLKQQMRAVYDTDRTLQRARCTQYRVVNAQAVAAYQVRYVKENKDKVRIRDTNTRQRVEYKLYRRIKRKYGQSIPVPIIREILSGGKELL